MASGRRDRRASAARGLSNKHIARELAISEGTVKIHWDKTFEKLGNVNRTSLAVLMRTAEGLHGVTLADRALRLLRFRGE